jgi:LMBR1 domain-containing protein 1
MIPNGTYLNSLLFNLAIILLCTIPVIQFCTMAFADYARFSDIYQVFDVQISYLHFFSEFQLNKVFVYIIFITSLITLLYILWRPRDTGASPDAMKDELQRRSVGL